MTAEWCKDTVKWTKVEMVSKFAGSKEPSGKVQADSGHWQPISESSEEKDI